MPVKLFIEPLDTLFFRDSRPFTAGEDALAESNPPLPITMYGAIGSYYLDTLGHSLSDFINGRATGTKLGNYSRDLKGSGFTIKGPYFVFDGKPHFPAPVNLWVYGDGRSPHILRPADMINGKRSDMDIPPVLIDFEGEIKPLQGFISLDDMQTYLSGGKKPWRLQVKCSSDLYLLEDMVGHQIDPASGTVKEGMLYSARHLRFLDSKAESVKYKKTSLLVVVDALDVGNFVNKLYCIGGERRGTHLIPVELSSKLVPESEDAIDKMTEFQRFSVYLSTPAIFSKGWTRGWLDIFGDIQLVGAAVNKPQHMSGWMRNGRGVGGIPRELKRLAPAGSVYFFKTSGWTRDQFDALYKKYHFGESLSDGYPDAGFGIALLGVW